MACNDDRTQSRLRRSTFGQNKLLIGLRYSCIGRKDEEEKGEEEDNSRWDVVNIYEPITALVCALS